MSERLASQVRGGIVTSGATPGTQSGTRDSTRLIAVLARPLNGGACIYTLL
jgi:hypothetical protein